ncbi:MAG: nucleotide kinase domain-containing protein, partial [Armatimonadota bacterium]
MVALGRLIVVEGPDGVGKSSIIDRVVTDLQNQGFQCIVYPFPGCEEGTLGAHVYHLHHEEDAFGIVTIDPASLQTLHVAAHLDAIARRIRPALQDGVHVILDRYWWSTWVYGAKAGVPEPVLDALVALERCGWEEIQPAVVFLLRADAPWREGEAPETFQKISALYDQLAQREKAHYPVHVIHNTSSMDECIAVIATNVQETLTLPLLAARQMCRRPQQQQQVPSPHAVQLPMTFTRLEPAVPSPVFETYWRFAAERQQVFFRRWAGAPSPWTDNPILHTYKFTNAYRAADRVSQYLIRHVIYRGDSAPEEVFFRTILFKLFNRIDTWELLCAALGDITWADFDFDRYTTVLESAMAR